MSRSIYIWKNLVTKAPVNNNISKLGYAEKMPMFKFNIWIDQQLKDSNATIKDFSQRAGVDYATALRWFQSNIPLERFRPPIAQALAQYRGCPPQVVMEESYEILPPIKAIPKYPFNFWLQSQILGANSTPRKLSRAGGIYYYTLMGWVEKHHPRRIYRPPLSLGLEKIGAGDASQLLEKINDLCRKHHRNI